MHAIQSAKTVCPLLAASTTNAGTATALIDTLGYDHARVSLIVSSAAATELASVTKLEDCDTSNGSMSAIVALTGGTQTSTSVGFVIPAPPTNSTAAAAPWAVWDVDLEPRKRWLKVTYSPVTTQTLTVVADLTGPERWTGATTESGASASHIVV